MLPGPILIKQCPYCKDYIREHTLASGNTFGTKRWSDGWVQRPMLPELPRAVLCPHCRQVLWLVELEVVEEVDLIRHATPLYHQAASHLTMEVADHLAVLDQGELSLRKEIFLRVRLWWRGNDPRREGPATKLTTQELNNIERLLEILPADKEGVRLVRADLLRTLGRFDQAQALLDYSFSPKYKKTAQELHKLTAAKVTRVVKLKK